MVKSGQIDSILNAFKEKGMEYTIFTDIKPNPTIENVQSAAADACAPGNPKPAPVEDFKALFRKIM